MRGRIASTLLAVGTIAFALSVGHADAKSDKESSSATSTDVGVGWRADRWTHPHHQSAFGLACSRHAGMFLF